MVQKLTRNRIVSVLFVALIAAPGLVGVFAPAGDIAVQENRAAAALPSWPQTMTEFNAAPRAVDAYLEDRFGFREVMISMHLWARDQLSLGFAETKALIGKDGWLFLNDGDALDMYMGRLPFRSGEADAWLAGAADLRDAVEARGGTFAVLIAPQKATVYGEFLPDFIPAGRAPSRLDVLAQGARPRGIAFVNVKARMLSAKENAQQYYPSDTHWTPRGAWEGYQGLMDRLENDGVAAPRIAEARVAFTERSFSGDLARMVNRSDRFAETAPGMRITDATAFEERTVDAYVFDSFKTRIIETDIKDAPTLLIIGDSYANALIPYLRESFSRIVFSHHQLGAFDRAILDEYPSDVVLLQMVERMLVHPLAPPQ